MNAGHAFKRVMRATIWLLDTLAWPFAVVIDLVLRGLLRALRYFTNHN